MPVPIFVGLGPEPSFEEIVRKLNKWASELNNIMLNMDSLNVRSLTADHIDSGTIDANIVTIRSDLTSGAYVQINGNGMSINNGTYDTFTADINGFVTMTGALVRSASGYPRIELSGANNIIVAYQDVDHFVSMTPIGLNPAVQIFDRIEGRNLLLYNSAGRSVIDATGNLQVGATLGDLFLKSTSGFVKVDNWSSFYSTGNAQSLQTALNSKANAFTGLNGTVYVAPMSGAAATFPITLVNGVCT